MTLNKYNEYMSHIEVTDEMKARVLAGVSKAIEEQKENAGAKTVVTPMPIKKKHISIVPLISIAATVLIVGGIAVLFVSNYLNSNTSAKSSHSKKTAEATNADYAAAEMDSEYITDGYAAPEAGTDSDSCDDEEGWIEETTAGEEETMPVSGVTKVPDDGSYDGNEYLTVPITNLETSVTEENGISIITMNGDENSAIVYIANDDTDLSSLYLNGVQAKVNNGVTDRGINYALYNTLDPDSSSYNAATFAYAGNTYLIVLEKPLPEDNIREFITEY